MLYLKGFLIIRWDFLSLDEILYYQIRFTAIREACLDKGGTEELEWVWESKWRTRALRKTSSKRYIQSDFSLSDGIFYCQIRFTNIREACLGYQSPWLLQKCMWSAWKLRKEVRALKKKKYFIYRWDFLSSNGISYYQIRFTNIKEGLKSWKAARKMIGAPERWGKIVRIARSEMIDQYQMGSFIIRLDFI